MNLSSMKIIKVNFLTIYFLLILLLCGYLKAGLVIFFIVIIHELGHVLFIKLFHYPILDITLYPFGGVTRVSKDINTPVLREVLIASGGIILQIILFMVVFLLPLRIGTKALIYKYNLSIMVFNMLPIIPLDGSIILNAILNRFFSFKISYFLYWGISCGGIGIYLLGNWWFSLNNFLIVVFALGINSPVCLFVSVPSISKKKYFLFITITFLKFIISNPHFYENTDK